MFTYSNISSPNSSLNLSHDFNYTFLVHTIFDTLKFLVHILSTFYIPQKCEKPGIVELGGTPKAKDESEHRQLQVIQ